jgi:transposase
MTGRKLSDVERCQATGKVIGGMSYRQTTERFNVRRYKRNYKTLFRRSLINRPIQNYRYYERILYVIQLSDRVYIVTFPAYRQTTERFNVSHSVIVRLKQRVNQTGNAKEHQRTWQLLKTARREDRLIKRFARQQLFSNANTLWTSRLASFYIWQFSTCHVEIKLRQFKVLPALHVQLPIWKPRQTWVL